MYFDVTVAAIVGRLTMALRVTGSIALQNKYLYGLQVVVPDLVVYVFVSLE